MPSSQAGSPLPQPSRSAASGSPRRSAASRSRRSTGPAAGQAKAAALDAAGGGTVLEMEHQDGDGAGMYEVEVRRTDGSTVEIHLDGQFKQVGSATNDDSGSESENGAANDD